MLDISAPNAAARAARALVWRDFLRVVARNRATGAAQPADFWSDVGPFEFPLVNPDTGLVETRTAVGSGTLIKISDIPRVSSVTVQTVTIEMSQIDDAVAQLVRGYDVKFGRVEIYRGYFDPISRLMAAAAHCRFIGLVDGVEITTPKEGEAGSIVLSCVSHTQEMTRSNPAKRSDADQRLRNPTDNFLQDVNVVDDWNIVWGKAKKAKSKKKFLGLF